MSQKEEREWKEFFLLLEEIEKKEVKIPVFLPDTNKDDPKTWEELVERVKELPGDDPITWLPLDSEDK